MRTTTASMTPTMNRAEALIRSGDLRQGTTLCCLIGRRPCQRRPIKQANYGVTKLKVPVAGAGAFTPLPVPVASNPLAPLVTPSFE